MLRTSLSMISFAAGLVTTFLGIITVDLAIQRAAGYAELSDSRLFGAGIVFCALGIGFFAVGASIFYFRGSNR